MNKKFCILTDSSCSKELLQDLGSHIQILPLEITDEEGKKYDGLESFEFMELLKTNKIFKTSTTPMGKMFEYFENLSNQYDLVIYLSISSLISSQYSQAQTTVKELDLSDKFWVFDTKCATLGLSQIVLAVNEFLTNNPEATYQEIEKLISDVGQKNLIWFTCNEVKRLIKSGRGGQKLFSYFNKFIRPIIWFRGKNQLLSVSPTMKGAVNKMLKLSIKELLAHKDQIKGVFVLQYSQNSIFTDIIRTKLAQVLEIEPDQIQVLMTPSIVACHTGLETYGIGIQLK